MVDRNTQQKNHASCARVLIDLLILHSAPKHIVFENENRILTHQDVKFEWKPVQCGKCNGYGHI